MEWRTRWLCRVLVGTAALIGWQTGFLREWASHAQMALFRHSLTRALDGESWRVERAAILGPNVWIFDLRRDEPDSTSLYVSFLPSPQAASDHFARNGNRFVEPVAVLYSQGSPWPPVQFAPPLISHASLPGLAEANFVWNGYCPNTRGVVKFRQGRAIALINAPSIADAERVGRTVAALFAERGY